MRHSHVITSQFYRISVRLETADNSLSMGGILEDAYPVVHSNLKAENRRLSVPSRINQLLQKQTGIVQIMLRYPFLAVL